MEINIDDFYHDFVQDIIVSAESNGNFILYEFMSVFSTEIIETGFNEGVEICHFRAQRGMRVDGYWFDEQGGIDLFIADFESRDVLTSLTKTEMDSLFKRASNFFEACKQTDFYNRLENTSPEYSLARNIYERRDTIETLRVYIFSERVLSERVISFDDNTIAGVHTSYNVWDISRLYRIKCSRNHREVLEIDFIKMFHKGIPCIPAHLGNSEYDSYLLVMPGNILANLYQEYGARLLEQNVRTFLQARGAVNKNIRNTILQEPSMFFAYNNGLSATAKSVNFIKTDEGVFVNKITDLQIVNGGQTTASLFYTRKRDKADLSEVFVQVKLTVVDNNDNDVFVSKISEYANTQNRVNAADFFSNHPFHIRMESFSRRIWAPAQKNTSRETKWFYERSRGQYIDAQNKLTLSEQKRFKNENPKSQMFTKTELAKFENVWDEHPKWVNFGAQKNFSRYAARIGIEWEKKPDGFNEFYFKRVVCLALLFKTTEKIISNQDWYNGGYRSNIVSYTISTLSLIIKRKSMFLNFLDIWKHQKISVIICETLAVIAREIKFDIFNPPMGISNISEWCKKDACWTRIEFKVDKISNLIDPIFFDELIFLEEQNTSLKSARETQIIDNGIESQVKAMQIDHSIWKEVYKKLSSCGKLTEKENDILKIAISSQGKLLSEKQSKVLITLLNRFEVI